MVYFEFFLSGTILVHSKLFFFIFFMGKKSIHRLLLPRFQYMYKKENFALKIVSNVHKQLLNILKPSKRQIMLL